MENIGFEYSEEDMAWVSDIFVPQTPLIVEIMPKDEKKNWRAVINQGDSPDGEFPKLFISPFHNGDFQFTIDGDMKEDRYLRIALSEEPEYIRYHGQIKNLN